MVSMLGQLLYLSTSMEPTDGRVDHTVPSQAEAPTNNSGGQSIIDTPSFDEPAGGNPDVISTFESSMPPMSNLQTAGLRRSSRIAAQ